MITSSACQPWHVGQAAMPDSAENNAAGYTMRWDAIAYGTELAIVLNTEIPIRP